ncbi:hypothetical protein, partial [Microcoleus sp. Aus8_D1]|uniref:hypothetical protein n=1 Tax=Microcoleus sp. Aus8_D1 TaxID=3055302 RepID=UPI002FD48D83
MEIYRWVGRVYEYLECESKVVGEPAPTGIMYVEIYRWVGRVYEYLECESKVVGEPAPTGIM